MSAVAAVEPEYGDDDSAGDELAEFVMRLTVRLSKRGDLVRSAMVADIKATLQEMERG